MGEAVLHEPCSRCGRTLLELRGEASRESMKGAAPLCAVPACPLVQRVMGFAEPPKIRGTRLSGPSPPAVFVGRHGYPAVQMGPLLPALPELAPEWGDSPAEWARTLDIADILQLRSRLVRSKSLVRADAPLAAAGSGALDASRSLAMASRPLDTEVTLSKPPKLSFEPRLDSFAAPMGPSVSVVDARVLSSPSVPRKVDAIVSDVHADAATGTQELYEGGISAYHIQRLLSVGLLGRAKRRKLVPTRWSITATDDILGLQLIERVKEKSVLDKPEVYASSLFGNDFHVTLLPRAWAFEMYGNIAGRRVPKNDFPSRTLRRRPPQLDHAARDPHATFAARQRSVPQEEDAAAFARTRDAGSVGSRIPSARRRAHRRCQPRARASLPDCEDSAGHQAEQPHQRRHAAATPRRAQRRRPVRRPHVRQARIHPHRLR